MKRCNIDPSKWEGLAAQRLELRGPVLMQVRVFEGQRKTDLDAKRNNLKTRPPAAIEYNYVDGKLTYTRCECEFTK